jgi:hypothetical protein
MPDEIAKPNPDPRLLVVKNGSKIRSRTSGAIPGPVSEIVMQTCASVDLTPMVTFPHWVLRRGRSEGDSGTAAQVRRRYP